MATTKPAVEPIWANGSSLITDPGSTKKGTGWIVEKPPVEYMNWLQNMFNSFLAHVNERGIAQWDSSTTYLIGGVAYGSDGVIYQAVQENAGNDPTTDTTNTYWRRFGMAIKSIQLGVITIGSGSLTNTATVTEVDPDKSILHFLGITTNTSNIDDVQTRITLTDSTTITATRGGSTGASSVSYELVEYY